MGMRERAGVTAQTGTCRKEKVPVLRSRGMGQTAGRGAETDKLRRNGVEKTVLKGRSRENKVGRDALN